MSQGASISSTAGSHYLVIAMATAGIMASNVVAAADPGSQRGGVVTTGATITYMPSADDYYPPTSKDLRESGVVVVLGCYGTNGRMVTVDVKQTSRSRRLDNAALSLAKQVRVKPGTRDGKVATGCIDIPIEFRLPETATKA